MANLTTEKQEIFDYVFNSLGGGMVDVELDPAHYETAIKDALDRFRQRSDNSVEESYVFLPLVILIAVPCEINYSALGQKNSRKI